MVIDRGSSPPASALIGRAGNAAASSGLPALDLYARPKAREAHDIAEFCTIIGGRLGLIDNTTGKEEIFVTGDSFFLTKISNLTWVTYETVSKFYLTVEKRLLRVRCQPSLEVVRRKKRCSVAQPTTK